jgi:hypothetical protein
MNGLIKLTNKNVTAQKIIRNIETLKSFIKN